jgi:hypothetical protein
MNKPVTKLHPEVEVAAPDLDPLAKLREPFPANQISKLPKESKKQADERRPGRTRSTIVRSAAAGTTRTPSTWTTWATPR